MPKMMILCQILKYCYFPISLATKGKKQHGKRSLFLNNHFIFLACVTAEETLTSSETRTQRKGYGCLSCPPALSPSTPSNPKFMMLKEARIFGSSNNHWRGRDRVQISIHLYQVKTYFRCSEMQIRGSKQQRKVYRVMKRHRFW